MRNVGSCTRPVKSDHCYLARVPLGASTTRGSGTGVLAALDLRAVRHVRSLDGGSVRNANDALASADYNVEQPYAMNSMLGKYISDLEDGDVLEPVAYVMTPFISREYCHGVEELSAYFHSKVNSPLGRQVAPPTLCHIDKIRLYRRNCPKGHGPNARIHYEYRAQHFEPFPINTQLVASGLVSDRYNKRGRDYVEIEIETRVEADDRLIARYHDTAIMSYKRGSSAS